MRGGGANPAAERRDFTWVPFEAFEGKTLVGQRRGRVDSIWFAFLGTGRELDPSKVKAIEQKYRAGRQRIARDFSASLAELERKISELSTAIARAKSNADGAVRDLAQARADLKVIE